MSTIKATVGINTNNLKGRVSQNGTIVTKNVTVGPRSSLDDMTDIDMSLKEQGAMLVWDATANVWRAKQHLEDGTSFEGCQY